MQGDRRRRVKIFEASLFKDPKPEQASPSSSGSDESCCPLRCRKGLIGEFLTSSGLLFVSSSSLQSQYTQGDFPTTLPQVRNHTPTLTFFLPQILIVWDSDNEYQEANSLVLLPSFSICMSDVLQCAESLQVGSSINERLFREED